MVAGFLRGQGDLNFIFYFSKKMKSTFSQYYVQYIRKTFGHTFDSSVASLDENQTSDF